MRETKSKKKRFVTRLLKNKEVPIAAGVLMVIILAAIFAPYVTPKDPYKQDISKRLLPPVWHEKGDPSFYLGTDQLGRDMLSRLIYGGRVSIFVGFTCASIAAVIGVMLGVISGYFGGRYDDVIMRVADVQLSFPYIILAIALIAVMGPKLSNIMIVLVLTSWVRFARVARADSMLLREFDYIAPAKALGGSHKRIIFCHIIPNIISPIIVIATLEIPRMILMEALLSFLGLGIQPPPCLMGFDGERWPGVSPQCLVAGDNSRSVDNGCRAVY